jgi:hypothetical protein
MTIHQKPRDVLEFKPKLVSLPPKIFDRKWATAVAAMREAISEAQNLAMETSHRHPERFAELSTILLASEAETQLLMTSTMSGGGDLLHEMHRNDPNYTDPHRECEFAKSE